MDPSEPESEKTIADSLSTRIKDPEHRIDIIATVLMSIAIVCSAYCAYQATRWSGVQDIAFDDASAARVEANKAANAGRQQMAYDASTLLIEIEAAVRGEAEVANILRDRFTRKEFEPFVEEWLAMEPLNNPDAPETPFDLPNFSNAELLRADSFQDEVDASVKEAREANQNGDNYILATVFFALVLFFTGISTKIEFQPMQWVILAFASGGLVLGLVRMFSLPYH
jgi:hypothetical protein